MGMYTGLRGKVEIKDEFVAVVTDFINNNTTSWSDFLPESCEEFYSDPRANFIPFGCVNYMPDDWNYESYPTMEGKVLSFECSLKNYNNTIQSFLNCLDIIADSWKLEELYEEADESILHSND